MPTPATPRHWSDDLREFEEDERRSATVLDPHAPSPQMFGAVPGYDSLANVLIRAYHQAAIGKGAQRHAYLDEPFEQQMMQDMARRFGVGVLLGQAFKKSEESQRLDHDRAIAELLGAINYLAGAVIAMEMNHRGR